MTNEVIIMNESVRLMENGRLKGSGIYGKVIDNNGNEITIELPEEIHTFNGWKERGYIVKKGQKSDIKINIWKYSKKIKVEEKENGEKQEYEDTAMFMKLSAFFTAEQDKPLEV